MLNPPVFIFHPALRHHVEAMKADKGSRGLDWMAQQMLANADVRYMARLPANSYWPTNQPKGLFTSYPVNSIQALIDWGGYAPC